MFMLKRANPNLPLVFSVLSMSGSNGPTQRERIDGLVADMEKQSQLLNSTARLCLQTSHRQQSDTTRRSLVCFVKSDLRLSVLDRWHTWNKNAKLPPAELPTPPPPPLREQIGNLLCTYLLEKAEMLDIPQATLGVIKMLGKALEAITIIPDKDKEGDVQPVLLLFRPSETSMFVREALLDPVWPLSVAKAKISASVPRVCLTAVPTKRSWNNWACLHKQKVVAKVGVVPRERQRQVLPQRPSAVASALEGLTTNKHAFCSFVFVFYFLFFSLVSPRGAVPCGLLCLWRADSQACSTRGPSRGSPPSFPFVLLP